MGCRIFLDKIFEGKKLALLWALDELFCHLIYNFDFFTYENNQLHHTKPHFREFIQPFLIKLPVFYVFVNFPITY